MLRRLTETDPALVGNVRISDPSDWIIGGPGQPPVDALVTIAADDDNDEDILGRAAGIEQDRASNHELEVLEVVEDAETPGNPIVFDPMRLTDGIEPSADPILAARPKAYSVSIDRRTSA